jgi:rare lipoprotein A
LRPGRPVRAPRATHVSLGTSLLAVPASAVALTGVAAAAGFPGGAVPANQAGPIKADVTPKQLAYGHQVNVKGTAPSTTTAAAAAGRTLALERAAAPDGSYRTLETTRIESGGRFSFIAPLKRSGFLRVVELPSASRASAAAPGSALTPSSAPQRVSVEAALHVPKRPVEVLGGHAVALQGRLLPRLAGRRIQLESRSHHAWHSLTSARTGAQGGFRLRFVPQGLGQEQLRVTFGGDRTNTRIARRAGVTVFTESVASWYTDAGNTACGFHATYGVANRSLPCGSKVTFHYAGRTVNAVVDDRGPFVGGREWDLNQNTASALSFGGVGTVWSSR